ncbi:MAG TPA: response regulator transcription factor [Candidatus Acidoferrales bacterium]|jgi:DNA-binding response OmpR family regulator|nr:response regulator transcription factor [Candidatus Acidoferrales bacterium]
MTLSRADRLDARVRVLICDSDPRVVGAIAHALGEAGLEVVTFYRADAAISRLLEERPDLVVLGPSRDLDPLVAIPRLQAREPVPVLAISSARDEASIVAVLEAGADDVLDSAFRPLELVARVRALLRRRTPPAPAPDTPLPDGLRIDPGRREASVDGRLVELTPIEFELLCAIGSRRGDVVDHRTLLRAGWPGRVDADPDLLRTHLTHLNGKLVAAGHPGLRNVRSIGYALRVEGGTGPA